MDGPTPLMVGTERAQGDQLMRKFIPFEEVAKEWIKDPAFVAAYDALEDEFALALALIKAPCEAGISANQNARR